MIATDMQKGKLLDPVQLAIALRGNQPVPRHVRDGLCDLLESGRLISRKQGFKAITRSNGDDAKNNRLARTLYDKFLDLEPKTADIPRGPRARSGALHTSRKSRAAQKAAEEFHRQTGKLYGAETIRRMASAAVL